MNPLYTQLQKEIHEITTLDGVYDFLVRNDKNIKLLRGDIVDYEVKVMDMLQAKQKSLQGHVLTS